MRIPCPHCGERGHEEFSILGAADPVRPGFADPLAAWHDYVHLRPNPRGCHRELWQHVSGCRRWLVVTRDTATHAILGAADASQASGAGASGAGAAA